MAKDLKPKSPKDRLIELEDMLQSTESNYIGKYYLRFCCNFMKDCEGMKARRDRYVILRDFLTSLCNIMDIDFKDTKEYIAYAQLRSEALDLLIKEMVNEERTVLAIGRSQYNMDDSLSLIDKMHKHREALSLKIDEKEMKTPMTEYLPI